jgi:hypothetical protein
MPHIGQIECFVLCEADFANFDFKDLLLRSDVLGSML